MIPAILLPLAWIAASAIAATNRAPTANAQTVALNEDTTAAITLNGTDPEGAALTYSISQNPTKGTLTCSGSACTFTPNANFNGADWFYFKVSDGSATSRAARVDLTIAAVNDAPTATGTSVGLVEDGSSTVRPSKGDVDGDSTTWQLVVAPTKGSAAISGDAIVYTPSANANGSDSFQVSASDGSASSAPATVSLSITAVNDAPTASDQSVSTNEDEAIAVTIAASDVDGDSLTASIGYASNRGTVSVSGNVITYTPEANYSGEDTFTYRAFDGSAYSSTATVSVSITAVNDAPTVSDSVLELRSGESRIVSLKGADAEESALTYEIRKRPSHGRAVITGSVLTYTATAGYTGSDSIVVVASDGEDDSAGATVSATILESSAITPIDVTQLELIEGVTTTVSGDSTVVSMAYEGCHQFVATPLVLPLKLEDGSTVEAAVGALHSACLNRVAVENYVFLVRTDNGQAYRFSSERSSGLDPNAKATGFYDPATGTLVTPLVSTSVDSEDPDEPTGGLLVQQGGGTEYFDTHQSRAVDTSLLFLDGAIPISTDNHYLPTCQTGAKLNSEYCGVWGFADLQARSVLDIAFASDNGYEAWLTSAQTRVRVLSPEGKVARDLLAWGTGPGGSVGDAADAGGGCRAFQVDRRSLMESVYEGTFESFDLFATTYDPGDAGCADRSESSSSNLEGSAIQGEATVGFNPDTGGPAFWYKGYLPDVSGSTQTRIFQLNADFELVCETFVEAGAGRGPFNGVATGMAVATDGTAYTNASYLDSSGIPRAAILAIDPRDCSSQAIIELASPIDAFGGVTLASDSSGNEVALAAYAGSLYVVNLADGAYSTHALGSSTNTSSAPVIDSSGRVVIVSEDNVMTIVDGLGLSYGSHFWPRFRKDNLGLATVSIQL